MNDRSRRPEAPRPARTGLADAAVVWAVMLAVGVEVLVTYTRIPVRELYHVRSGGIAAGAGRTLAPAGVRAVGGTAIVSGLRAAAWTTLLISPVIRI